MSGKGSLFRVIWSEIVLTYFGLSKEYAKISEKYKLNSNQISEITDEIAIEF